MTTELSPSYREPQTLFSAAPLTRDERRRAGAYVRDAVAAENSSSEGQREEAKLWGEFFHGFCLFMDSRMPLRLREPLKAAIKAALQNPGVNCDTRNVYLPPGIDAESERLRRVFMDAPGGKYHETRVRYYRRMDKVRRIWLRHWEETGVALTGITFPALLAKRKAAALARKTKGE